MGAASPYCPHCGAANQSQAAFCFACGHHLAEPAPTGNLATNQTLKGRYRLLRLVGKGGFGAVYQAEDTQLGDRPIAVKEMSQHGLSAEELAEATESFHQEALLLAKLTHPNLPRIYEQFEESGHWYLVMDFIEGETLETYLGRAPGGRLPVGEALQLGLQLAAVLVYLHTRQPPIIFRDLKPANVMLTADGQVYLIDFGIARLFKPGQTKDTVAFGSAGYAAPEQYGKTQTTTQSDIYSLGATLHQMLSGRDPADTPFVFAPLGLASPAGLDHLIMQMVEADQQKRPASMADVKQELQRLAAAVAADPQARKPASVKLVLQPALSSTSSAAPASTPVAAVPPEQPQMKSRPRGTLLHIYRGHQDIVKAVAWSPDGKRIASGAVDNTLQVWSATTGKYLLTYQGHVHQVNTVAWSPDGTRIASGSADKTVHICDAASGKPLLIYQGHKGFFADIFDVAWSPDGTRIASASYDWSAQVWDAVTGETIVVYQGHKHGREGGVHAVAWSPDANRVASGGSDKTVRVWNATSGEMDFFLGPSRGVVNTVAWSPDGRRIALGDQSGLISVWDAAYQKQLLTCSGHEEAVNAVAWSPDGIFLASASSDGTERIWDAASGTMLFTDNHGFVVQTVAWSPDGQLLASGGDAGTVEVWQAR